MPNLIVGQNSYVTLAEADAYLAGSLRAAAVWAALTDDEKVLALITAHRSLELQAWEGARTEVDQIASVAITAAGTGYAEDDVLTLVGGDGTVAQVKVLAVGGGGEIQSVLLLHTGFYTEKPASPVATTVAPAGGSACTLTPTYAAEQVMDWPRTITCATPAPVTDDVPTDIKAGQAELAFEYNQNPSLEVGQGTEGTSSNTRRVKAGSAEVEFFAPTTGVPYPPSVWQRINIYREGACASGDVGMAAFGTDGESVFEDRDNYDLNRGYS